MHSSQDRGKVGFKPVMSKKEVGFEFLLLMSDLLLTTGCVQLKLLDEKRRKEWMWSAAVMSMILVSCLVYCVPGSVQKCAGGSSDKAFKDVAESCSGFGNFPGGDGWRLDRRRSNTTQRTSGGPFSHSGVLFVVIITSILHAQ